MSKPTVTKITVARLYNTGSYEHMRYEITADVPDGHSAADAMIGLERIMEGLKPESKSCVKDHSELHREALRLADMRLQLAKLGDDEFRRRYGHFTGTGQEYIDRCQESHLKDLAKRSAWDAKSAQARGLLDDLGCAAKWKDAKLSWDREDNL